MGKGFGLASFILGIIAFPLGLIMPPFIITYGVPETWIAAIFILGSYLVIGLILGIIGAIKDEKKIFSIIGLILCSCAVIFFLIPLIFGLLSMELGLF